VYNSANNKSKRTQSSTFGIFSTYYIIKLSLINEKLKRGDKSEKKRFVN